MDLVAYLVVTALLVGSVWIVSRPLRGGAARTASEETQQIEDLLAQRETKYAEIRELELDHRTGKLSDEDFRAQDRVLRGEAIAILRRLDALGFSVDGRGEADAATVTESTDAQGDDDPSDVEGAPDADSEERLSVRRGR